MNNSSKHILLVDDFEGICETLSVYLKSLHYEVSCAYNGQEALDLFVNSHFDLVISDVKMPVMDGVALLYEIKA